jgi:hypothetical protein
MIATPDASLSTSVPDVRAQDLAYGDIRASFALSRVTLTDGRITGTTRGTVTQIPGALATSTTDAFHVKGYFGNSTATGIDAHAVYQIGMLGSPTGYWISTRLWEDVSAAWSGCTIYKGDPNAGGSLAQPSPFTCDGSTTRRAFPNARVTFTIALNRAAEAAGVIKTEGAVSLTAGHFEHDVPYYIDGATEVGQSASTRFETVLRVGDEPMNAWNSRMDFVYRIVDAGTPTTFWIAGWSNNYRGVKFVPDARCAVYDTDPVKSSTPLEQLKPVGVSPYDCEKTSDRTIGWNGAYEATFTAKKRPMKVVEEPLKQKRLVERVCANIDNCGLNLATVTSAYGRGRPVSDIINNISDTPMTASRTTSSKESITNSGGFAIETEAEFGEATLWGKYKITLKVHYERSVTWETSTSTTVPITIKPHSRGWLEGTPPMVHTEGEIIVHDGEHYYDLKNVNADFPDGEGTWALTVINEKLVSPAL